MRIYLTRENIYKPSDAPHLSTTSTSESLSEEAGGSEWREVPESGVGFDGL
jgi:hypothetical protein